MANTTFIIPAGRGTRHTNTWAEGERPKTPREGLMYLYPNGVPLTAMLSMMKTEKPKDSEFSDYTKSFPLQNSTLTGVYDSVGMGTPLSNGNYSVGKSIYCKVPEDFAKECREGHVVELRKESDQRAAIAGDVISVIENGASSCIHIKTIEAATNGTARNPTVCDRIWILTSAQEEGALMPNEVNYNPVKMWNYCQIIETAYSVTNTQLETELITGSALKGEKKEKFEIHGQMLEKMMLWGRRYEKIVNGKPKRYSMGMIPMINEYAPDNVFDFRLSTDDKFKGKEFEDVGLEYFDVVFAQLMKYGPRERVCFCGDGARIGLTALMRASGAIQLDPMQAEFGMWVERWHHNGLTLKIITHPLFAHEPSNSNTMLIFDPANIKEMALRNTRTKKRPEGEVDGIKESWLTETGLYFRFPPAFGLIHGVGLPNTQS